MKGLVVMAILFALAVSIASIEVLNRLSPDTQWRVLCAVHIAIASDCKAKGLRS